MSLDNYTDNELKEELRRRHPYAEKVQEKLLCPHEDCWPASMATACITVCKKCGAQKGPSGGWW